jgi:hypothetical protein
MSECPGCAILREELAAAREERTKLMDRLMAALSPAAFQAFQGNAAGPAPEVPSETVMDSEGVVWLRIAGKLVKQEDWKKMLDGAVYLDDAGRPVPAEEVNRAMDMLDTMIGGGKT